MANDKKKKINFWSVLLIAGGLIVLIYLISRSPNTNTSESVSTPTTTPKVQSSNPPGKDPMNATYTIEGKSITLVNGVSEETIPNSSAVVKTSYFNQPEYGDLNKDGIDDASFMLYQVPGGSGVFFYVVASIKTDKGYVGTNGEFLGDRIAPQNMQIRDDGTIVVNYADRPEGAPMTESPSQGVSKYFVVKDFVLSEVANPNL